MSKTQKVNMQKVNKVAGAFNDAESNAGRDGCYLTAACVTACQTFKDERINDATMAAIISNCQEEQGWTKQSAQQRGNALQGLLRCRDGMERAQEAYEELSDGKYGQNVAKRIVTQLKKTAREFYGVKLATDKALLAAMDEAGDTTDPVFSDDECTAAAKSVFKAAKKPKGSQQRAPKDPVEEALNHVMALRESAVELKGLERLQNYLRQWCKDNGHKLS